MEKVIVELELPKHIADELEKSPAGGIRRAIVDAITLYLQLQSAPVAASLQLTKKGG